MTVKARLCKQKTQPLSKVRQLKLKENGHSIMFYKIMFVAWSRGLKRTKYITGLVELVTNNSSTGEKLRKMEILTNARKKLPKKIAICAVVQ